MVPGPLACQLAGMTAPSGDDTYASCSWSLVSVVSLVRGLGRRSLLRTFTALEALFKPRGFLPLGGSPCHPSSSRHANDCCFFLGHGSRWLARAEHLAADTETRDKTPLSSCDQSSLRPHVLAMLKLLRTMLVLSRKIGEQLIIGDDICITVAAICGNQVRLGITAPPEIRVLRMELCAPEPSDASISDKSDESTPTESG